jgi:xylulokinase
MAAALGLNIEDNAPIISLGTSGTVFTTTKTRPTDPTGTVSGFADATDRYLPLACTLNCTLAIDKMASLLGITREDVQPAGEVEVTPYFDGERTPNLPAASGSITGLRHTTTAQQILQATYDGAVNSLILAMTHLDLAPDASITLIGGGAQGQAWQDTIRRLSGRQVHVPEAVEWVAYGAARQALRLAAQPLRAFKRPPGNRG